MESKYLIIDTNDSNFDQLVRQLYPEMRNNLGTLIPRYNEDKTKAIVQVKVSMDSWRRISMQRGVLYLGDLNGLKNELSNNEAEWNPEMWAKVESPMWNDHIDFAEGRIDKTKYMNRLRGT